MDSTPLTRLVLETAAFVAVASLLMTAVGLLVGRVARRSAPLRHGLLLGALALLLALPAVPFAATLIDADALPTVRWLEDSVSTDSTFAETLAEPVAHFTDHNDEASGATGSASARSMRTLTEDQIPPGAVLPGQRTAGLNPAARRDIAVTDPLRNVDWIAVGIAAVAAWLIGTLVSLSLTLRGARRVTRIVRQSSPVSDAAVLAVHELLARQLGLQRAPALRSSAGVGVPFAWGLLKPVVVLPDSLADAGHEARLRAILLHELAHVRRRDGWVGLLQRIAAALYWWNPLLHRLNARLAEARELICDAHVLAGGCPPRDYAEVLVELAARVTLPQPAAAISLLSRSRPQLTRRVQHLLEDPPMFTSLRSFGRLCVLGLMIVGATAAVLVAAVMFEEHRMSTVHMAPHAQFSAAYVGDHRLREEPAPRIAVPAAQPAAELFADSDPYGRLSGDSRADAVMPDAIKELSPEPNPSLTPDSSEALSFGPDLVDNQPEPEVNLFGRDELADGPPPVDHIEYGNDAPYYPGTTAVEGEAAKPETGPTPNPNWPPKGGPQFIGEGSIHALAAIDLVAGADGGLQEVRWFTESLGAGEEATLKLGERLKAFAATQPATVFGLEPRQTNNGTVYVAVPMQVGSAMQAVEPMRADGDFIEPLSGGGRAGRTQPGRGDEDYIGVIPSNTARAGAAGRAPAPLKRVLAAQLTASPQLQYQHVARVIALCEAHVERVIIGQLDMSPDLKLTLGFVRDGAGNKISSSPVLIWNEAVLFRTVMETEMVNGKPTMKPRRVLESVPDKIVEVHSLAPQLMNWRQTLKGNGAVKNLTALIRADDGVDPLLVEQVVQAVLPAGIERVVLEPLATPKVEAESQVEEVETAPVVEPAAPVVEPAEPKPI